MGISFNHVTFSWNNAPCLSIDRYDIPERTKLLIYGDSGRGKSTLLSLLAGFVAPDRGEILINGQDITHFSGHEQDRFRADHIGFIFQQFNLIPYLTADENIRLPCYFSKNREQKVKQTGGITKRKNELLSAFGLSPAETARKKTYELSIGQQQRVAAARALMGDPSIIIADEPTSALDFDNAVKFIDNLQEQTDKTGASLIVVSHDRSFRNTFPETLDIERFKP